MADLLQNLRVLQHGARAASQLDEEHVETLTALGMVELTKNPWGGTTASLTARGRQRLAELDTAGATLSPVSARASQELSNDALVALSHVSSGKPVDAAILKGLTSMGLVTQHNGRHVLTMRGHGVLNSEASHKRLSAISSPYRRG
jgi:hypothetical protein